MDMAAQNKVLFALSGGVDSSTAAAHLLSSGVTGDAVTLGLWGGERESKSCSTADSTAARHVAEQLGVPHTYVDWTNDFAVDVVDAFISEARNGRTTNPCITCNKKFKADRLFEWADTHGYTRIVTGHYARVVHTPDGPRIGRAHDNHKDQSYVLCAFEPHHIARLTLPLGELTKPQVRELARSYHLDVADNEESMGLCFSPRKVIATAALGNVSVVNSATREHLTEIPVGVAAVGQRRGLGISGNGEPLYVTEVHPDAVLVGPRQELLDDKTTITNWHWTGGTPPTTQNLTFQTSAHGTPETGRFVDDAVIWDTPHIRVTPGQVVAAYTTTTTNTGETIEYICGWGEAN